MLEILGSFKLACFEQLTLGNFDAACLSLLLEDVRTDRSVSSHGETRDAAMSRSSCSKTKNTTHSSNLQQEDS